MRVGRAAAAWALAFSVLSVGLGGAAMVGGGADVLFFAATWRFGWSSSIGVSALLGVPAMLVLMTGFVRANRMALATGAVVGIGSFLVTGHAATATPAGLMIPAVALHLVCAAYWLGALLPLFARAEQPDAPAVFARFSARAVYAVALVVLSGAAIAAVQLASFEALVTTDYGRLFMLKIALVSALMGLAAVNRFVLSPRLAEGAGAMRRSIAIELGLFALILAAAASLTTVPPPRTL